MLTGTMGIPNLCARRKIPFLKGLHVAVAGARAFGESDQADARIERGFGALRHDFQAFAAGRVRHGNISEAAHHPAVDRHFEVRFQFEAAQELRDGRVDHERVENIYVVADENAGASSVESRGATHFEARACETENIAEKCALRPIVLAWIDDSAEQNENCAHHREMNPLTAHRMAERTLQIGLLHTITSSAAGRISRDWHSRRMLSPSTITFTGPASSKSMRFVAAREALR